MSDSLATTEIPAREKLTKKAITADSKVDRAVPCAMSTIAEGAECSAT
jgi:hypothetical protein